METANTVDETGVHPRGIPSISGANHRTLDAIFRHPLSHNLEWRAVVALMAHVGDVQDRANNDVVFTVAGHSHVMRKPHTKDLTSSEVMEVRHFLERAGLSPALASQPAAPVGPATGPALLIIVDYHGAKIFHVDVTSDDASAHAIRPHDPHHVLKHLAHRDQAGEPGRRVQEEAAFYEAIAAAVAGDGKIVIIGHGTGNSDSAHHLTAYLKTRHGETHARVAAELTADLSHISDPQLLDLARQALPRA